MWLLLSMLLVGMWMGRDVLAYLYTADESVAALAAVTVPSYILWALTDTSAFIGGCVLRGAGKQPVREKAASCFRYPHVWFKPACLGLSLSCFTGKFQQQNYRCLAGWGGNLPHLCLYFRCPNCVSALPAHIARHQGPMVI